MSKRRVREHISSSSSQETSPIHKILKMSDEEHVQEDEEPPTLSMIYKILMEVQGYTKKIMHENSIMKAEHEELKGSVAVILQENEELKAKCKQQQDEVRELNFKVNKLEDSQDDLNQYQRKHNLEFHGIPEMDEEDLEAIVGEIAKEIDVDDFEYNDIDIVHRLPSKLKPRPIIVKFKYYNDKKNLYAARWKLKKFQNESEQRLNGAKRIYINENLTSQRRKLFTEVRKRAKQNHWHSAWTTDGKIFIKKERGGRSHKIGKQADLEDFYF